MRRELQAQCHTCVQRSLQRRTAQTRKYGQSPSAAQECGHRLCALLRARHGYAAAFTSLALPLLWAFRRAWPSDGPNGAARRTLGNVRGFLHFVGMHWAGLKSRVLIYRGSPFAALQALGSFTPASAWTRARLAITSALGSRTGTPAQRRYGRRSAVLPWSTTLTRSRLSSARRPSGGFKQRRRRLPLCPPPR